MLGAWWCYPFGPLASSHSSFAALLLLFKYLCLLLLVSLFDFLNDCGVAFFSGTWPSGCSVLICMSVMFGEFLVCLILRYFFFFKVLEPILGFSCVAAATLLTPRHYHWACF